MNTLRFTNSISFLIATLRMISASGCSSSAEDSFSQESALKCAADDWACQEPAGSDTGTQTSVTCYRDADGDGLGSINSPKAFVGSCGTGYVAKSGDCDDSDPTWQGLKCYTDNDHDGQGGTLQSALYCGSRTTCPKGHTSKAGDCGSASSCFEQIGKSALLLSYFEMKLIPDSGLPSATSYGSVDTLSGSSVVGTMAKDGTYKFAKSEFVIRESHITNILGVGDVVITTSVAATSDVTSKVSPSTGQFSIFQVPAKVTVNAKKVGDTGSGANCAESLVALKLKSVTDKPYNSSNGSFSLVTAEAFALDKVSESGGSNDWKLCSAMNGYLPAHVTMTVNAQALDPRPIASWPALSSYDPGQAK